jgi:hypothetical protein
MTTTTYLGLETTDSASGSATTFIAWRLAQNNTTNSNATKIDTFAQNTNASVVALQGYAAYRVTSNESTTNNYVATVASFPGYNDGVVINLSVDVTVTGTTTLNINSLGTKSLYKILGNGTATNLASGDLVAGRINTFVYYLVGGYWLWVDGTSADQINIAGNVNEIAILSGSGLMSSGISASSLGLVDAYYLVYQLSSGLTNERQIIAGSGIGLVQNTSASTWAVTANLIGGAGVTLSNNTSTSAITINATAASNIAPPSASYVLWSTLDSTLTNDVLVTAGSGMAITKNNSSSRIILDTQLTAGSGTTIGVNTTASALQVHINALAPLSASAAQIKHNTSGVTAGTYTLSSTTIDDTGHVTSASSGLIASATQTSSGSSATALVSASGLAQSNYGTKTVCIPLNTSTALAGGETNYVRIPQYMNEWKLIDVAASCGAPNGSGSSTSGSPSFTLSRSSASSMTQVSLITNVVMIDASEFDSSTSASPVVISATNTIYTGDKVWAATSASGTGVTYVSISPTFRNMP